MPRFNLPRKQFFENLKVLGASNVLRNRGYLDDDIEYEGLTSTPGLVLKGVMKDKGLKSLAANIGPVKFFGGPPSNLRWFTGSMLTYVLDRVYYSNVTAQSKSK